jgi:IMP dehydrogenase
MGVVDQVKQLNEILKPYNKLIVGNFATAKSINDFMYHLGFEDVDAFKVGIGGGSACLTRVVTGCGIPTFGSVQDCVKAGYPIIADGGIRNSGDFAKALGAGAAAVMVGGMLAGCEESPGELFYQRPAGRSVEYISAKEMTQASLEPTNYLEPGWPKPFKKYRGSASKESYGVQGKISEWRTPEGDSFLVPYKGPVAGVLQELESGLRSAMSYVGAENLTQFRNKVEFIRVTPSGAIESGSHGKT